MFYVAPAGTPISLSDLGHWIGRSIFDRDLFSDFSEQLQEAFKVKHAYFISSGRAGLYLLLECLKDMRERDARSAVIVPSYTCYSVPASVEKAGLTIQISDIDTRTLGYDIEKLRRADFSNVLAIVTSSLYGIPDNLPDIEEIARINGVYLIDDAAQCMGGMVGGRHSGSFGIAGIYSLDKGKNITSLQGGVVVTNSDSLAALLERRLALIPGPRLLTTLSYVAKMFAYALLLHPNLYWIPARLPILGLGQTPYTTDYPVAALSRILGAMALILFGHLNAINVTRRANAKALIDIIVRYKQVYIPQAPQDAVPVYLRLPILIDGPTLRAELLDHLCAVGIGASVSYPTAVADIRQLRSRIYYCVHDSMAGRYVADRIITLPTHPYVSERHRQVIIDSVNSVLGAP